MLLRPNVRQHLLLQNPRRITDAIVLRHVPRRSPPPDEVQRHLLLLYDERFLQRGAEEVHHLPVCEVVHDVLDDVPVGHVSQRAEDDDHGNVRSDVRQGAANLIPFDTSLSSLLVHLNVQRGRWSRAILHLRSRFDHPREFRGLFLFKGVDMVITHAFLRDNYFLTAIDDEVSPLIVNALPQIGQLSIVFIGQNAKERTEHDGNVSQKFLTGLFGGDGSAHIFGRITDVAIRPDAVFVHGNIHVKGCGVR
mmetsp:Transcript_23649/g.49539  ORF Transcript_23649/g.49539 Transcript_23649/m.49539 type:complete len:250 (+) Transcript_23649:2580-3329(+)